MLSCGGNINGSGEPCLQDGQQCVQWYWNNSGISGSQSAIWGRMKGDGTSKGYCKLSGTSPMRGEQWLASPPAASLNVDKSTNTVLFEPLGCHFCKSHKAKKISWCLFFLDIQKDLLHLNFSNTVQTISRGKTAVLKSKDLSPVPALICDLVLKDSTLPRQRTIPVIEFLSLSFEYLKKKNCNNVVFLKFDTYSENNRDWLKVTIHWCYYFVSLRIICILYLALSKPRYMFYGFFDQNLSSLQC